MKFSIVIPSYNQGDFIGKTLESIFTQKGDFFIECLVFDGGSTDKTVEIIKGYELRIKNNEFKNLNKGITFYWQSEKDRGQSDAINKGLKKSTGDILAYLNSDDTYVDGAFEEVSDAFAKSSKKKWLTGYCNIVDQNDKPIRSAIAKYKNFWLRNYSYNKLLVINFVSQPATFWKKEIMEDDSFLDENLSYTMDYDFWLRLGKNSDPIIVEKSLANFRIHGQSKGETAFFKQFKQDKETADKYCKNNLLRTLHTCHNQLIIGIYRIIK